MGTAALTRPTEKCKVFCTRNGRYYSSKETMQRSLKAARTIRGTKTKYNRKRRSMVNGRMYVNKERMRIALNDSIRQSNPENLAQLHQMSINNTGNKVTAAKISKAMKKQSKKLSKRMKKYMGHAHVKEFHRMNIELTPEMRTWATENPEQLVKNLTTHRKGKQVIEYVDCERTQSTGVVHAYRD